jgi:hypothetical protein
MSFDFIEIIAWIVFVGLMSWLGPYAMRLRTDSRFISPSFLVIYGIYLALMILGGYVMVTEGTMSTSSIGDVLIGFCLLFAPAIALAFWKFFIKSMEADAKKMQEVTPEMQQKAMNRHRNIVYLIGGIMFLILLKIYL